MSRIGRMPVDVPQGVDVEIKGSFVRVKGSKGQLEHTFPAEMDISMEDEKTRTKLDLASPEGRAVLKTIGLVE